ncbi:hypothetical protein [Oscillatoria sp. FACHB-1406]|nr:hypothetical protein [Oscillatoria sp. FACHB-1406]MBD2577068.1 hypothetical protein [Oscillatoria sp. FACHB-1406]
MEPISLIAIGILSTLFFTREEKKPPPPPKDEVYEVTGASLTLKKKK